MSTKYVLFYESADDVAHKAPVHFAEHTVLGDQFHASGGLVAYGAFADPQEQGAMAVFTSRSAAETFARSDPFVRNGVVRHWEIREWNEEFLP